MEPVAQMLLDTCNFWEGVRVPMPTLPFRKTVSALLLVVPLPFPIWNIRSVEAMEPGSGVSRIII